MKRETDKERERKSKRWTEYGEIYIGVGGGQKVVPASNVPRECLLLFLAVIRLREGKS
jgi:hypothetical protein